MRITGLPSNTTTDRGFGCLPWFFVTRMKITCRPCWLVNRTSPSLIRLVSNPARIPVEAIVAT